MLQAGVGVTVKADGAIGESYLAGPSVARILLRSFLEVSTVPSIDAQSS
jgi:hypothetical protein